MTSPDLEVAIIIPARLESTRLAKKALEYIGDKRLIEHVVSNLKNNFYCNIFVATDSEEIANAAKNYGALPIMTSPDCPSGSDRVHEALCQLRPLYPEVKYVINVQGDMPFLDTKPILDMISVLKYGRSEIVTAAVSVDKDVASKDSNVKLVLDHNGNAMYFSRSMIPYGGVDFLYHVGIYGFTVEALEYFVSIPVSEYEKIERLEQLRLLESGHKIFVCMCDSIPISVDTAEDLELAKNYYKQLEGK